MGAGVMTHYIDHPRIDWISAGVVFGAVGAWLTPLLPLGLIGPSVRFSVYAGLAAAILAFVTVAFTPLAILVALTDTPGVRRLRRHEDTIRGQFLRATLLMVLMSVTLLLCGAVDAARQSPGSVRFGASMVVGLAAMKMIRLTVLFWAVLTAGGASNTKPRRP